MMLFLVETPETPLIEKTERSDTTNLQSSIFNIEFSGLSGLGA